MPFFPVNALAFPEFTNIANGFLSSLKAFLVTFFDHKTEGALVLEDVKTPVMILPVSR